MIMKQTTLLLASLALVTACAHNSARNVQSNGEPLRVNVENRAYSYTVKEKVGEATHKDASGQVVGTTELTRDVVRTRRFKVWSFHQGNQTLDEQDFFALAGDTEAVAVLKKRRKKGMFYNRFGLGLAAVGIFGLAAASFGSGNEIVAKSGYILLWGLPIGGTMAFYGKRMVERRHMPLNRALDAVDAARAREGN